MPAEYGTSRDPLKLLTSLPRALATWARNLGKRFSPNPMNRGRDWIPVNTDTDGGDDAADASGDEENDNEEEEEAGQRGVGVEGDPADFEPLSEAVGGRGDGGKGVVISGLRKEFGDKVAVAGLDLRLLPGDITCLLGHNGAGAILVVVFL